MCYCPEEKHHGNDRCKTSDGVVWVKGEVGLEINQGPFQTGLF